MTQLRIVFVLLLLLAVNLIPLYGVFFEQWNTEGILLAYWMESTVVGYYSVRRIQWAQQWGDSFWTFENDLAPPQDKRPIIRFFVQGYALFMFIHLSLLLMLLIAAPSVKISFTPWPSISPIEFDFTVQRLMSLTDTIRQSWLWWMGLFASHFLIFHLAYIGHQEYKHAEVVFFFEQAFKRIYPMHLALIMCFFLSTGGVLLILLKTVIEAVGFVRERIAFSRPQAARAPAPQPVPSGPSYYTELESVKTGGRNR